MSTAIIACRMQEDELHAALARTGCPLEPVWLERQLHTVPERLHAELQATVDRMQAHDTLLLAFARCGNAVLGLRSEKATLVLPRFDDCLHMLCSTAPGDPGALDLRTLYITNGWLQGDRSFLSEYNQCLARHGEKKTRKVYDMMMGQYQRLALIDTGAFPLPLAEAGARATAEALRLEYTAAEGTIRVLEKLLRGQWDGDFVVKRPGAAITEEDFS